MIEDTSFVVDVLRGDDAALERLDQIERTHRPEKVASITVLELYEGIIRSSAPEERTRDVLEVLDSKPVVEADAAIMRRAGKLSGALYDRGEPIDREDCVIAATALLNDEPVVTRNTDHFERIDDLDVRSY